MGYQIRYLDGTGRVMRRIALPHPERGRAFDLFDAVEQAFIPRGASAAELVDLTDGRVLHRKPVAAPEPDPAPEPVSHRPKRRK